MSGQWHRKAQRLAQAMQDWCDNKVEAGAEEASDGPCEATMRQCKDDAPIVLAALSEAFKAATGYGLLVTTDGIGREQFVSEIGE
jgi:hypothetical protein